MIDSILGKTFRMLRKFKGIGIKEVVGPNLSYAQISKFETGKSSITSEKLFDGLLSINVSLEEFSRAYYENKGTLELLFPSKMNQLLSSKNIAKLEALLKENTEKENFSDKTRFRLNEIQIKAVIKSIVPKYKVPYRDINYLANYLLNLKIFTNYEYWLISSCSVLFDNKLLYEICNHLINQNQNVLDIPRLNQMKFDAILNIISTFISCDFFTPVPELLAYLEKNINSDLLIYEKATLTYLEAIYDLKLDFNNLQAQSKLRKCCSAFELFECYDTVNAIKTEFTVIFPIIKYDFLL